MSVCKGLFLQILGQVGPLSESILQHCYYDHQVRKKSHSSWLADGSMVLFRSFHVLV